MKKRFLSLFSLLFFFGLLMGPHPGLVKPAYGQQRSVSQMLQYVRSVSDDSLRQASVWDSLRQAGSIPYVVHDSVLFLYRGPAKQVAWVGDWNRWNQRTEQWFSSQALPGNIFYHLTRFDPHGRIDYKIIVDGNWILDPNNPQVQYSGFGPNSELRMGAWQADPIITERKDIPKGSLSEPTVIHSTRMGYKVAYQVYRPHPSVQGPYRVVYITDGHQYADPALGRVPIILDNLHAEGRIEPTLAVFIDPRDPDSGHNRRRPELVLHAPFQQFIDTELIPLIDQQYPTIDSPEARAILGTSLGGLNATYTAISLPHRFAKIGAHSPAYRYNDSIDQIYVLARNHDFKGQSILMTTGTLNDTEEGARQMRDLLQAKQVDLRYIEVPEGHSWGNWVALMDEMFLHFWPKKSPK